MNQAVVAWQTVPVLVSENLPSPAAAPVVADAASAAGYADVT